MIDFVTGYLLMCVHHMCLFIQSRLLYCVDVYNNLIIFLLVSVTRNLYSTDRQWRNTLTCPTGPAARQFGAEESYLAW